MTDTTGARWCYTFYDTQFGILAQLTYRNGPGVADYNFPLCGHARVHAVMAWGLKLAAYRGQQPLRYA